MSIYEFSNYRDFLATAAERHYGRKSRPFSLSVWAKRLGFRSPRSIAMVLKGQRQPSQQMIAALSRDQKLTDREHRYFELLILLDRAQNKGRDTRPILEAMKILAPQTAHKTSIDIKTFTYISSWHCLVIKQLIEREDFVENTAWIRQKLRRKVTEAEVRQAIQTMLDIKVLERDHATGKLQVSQKSLLTTQDLPSAAIRSHHEQMLTRAKEALNEQDVLSREFGSLVFKMNPSRIKEAKERLRAFRDAFQEEFADTHQGEVYQMNFQLFSHTDKGES